MKSSYYVLFLLIFSPLVNAQVIPQAMNLDSGTIPMSVECPFRATTKIICNDLIKDIFSFYTNTHQVNASEALISLSLTDEVGSGGVVNYTYSWTSKKETEVSDFHYSLQVNQEAMDPISIRSVLATNVATGVSGYSRVLSVSVEDGKMHVDSEPKGGVTTEGKESLYDRLAKSPLYVNLSAFGTYSARGNAPYDSKSTSINFRPDVAYLKNRYRVELNGAYSKTDSSVPNGEGYTHSSIEKKSLGSVFLYSFSDQPTGEKRKWSMAVFNDVSTDPNSNINLSSKTGAGIEYTAVPFRTTENKEISFRMGTRYNALRLGDANDLGNLTEKYMSVFARIYFYWLQSGGKLSFTGGGGVEQNLKYGGYQSYDGFGILGYQLNRATRLSGEVYYSYRAKSLTYPVDPDLSNALQVQQMNGQAGKSVYMQVKLDFTVGNTKRHTRDRRWIMDN